MDLSSLLRTRYEAPQSFEGKKKGKAVPSWCAKSKDEKKKKLLQTEI